MTIGDRHRIRFDPHVHTDASYDASGSVEEVLRQGRERGLDAVAITDHDTTAAARRAGDLESEYDVHVIPGVEISTADGHLLALGVTADPPVDRPLTETVEWTRERDGLAIVPHPFQRTRHGVGRRAIADCDAVEVFNAWAMTGLQNRRAGAFARRRGYPGLGSSDAHRPEMVGTAHTELLVDDPEPTTGTILEAIAHGRCQAVGRSATNGEYLRKHADCLDRWTRFTGRWLGRLGGRLSSDGSRLER